jgi:CRP-like cAMP-binding protein
MVERPCAGERMDPVTCALGERMDLTRRFSLAEDDAAALASRLESATFEAGEVILESRADPEWCFFMTSGLAAMIKPAEGGVEVGNVNAPGVIGLSPLFPGVTSSYRVVAGTRARCFGLPRSALGGRLAQSAGLRLMLAQQLHDLLENFAQHAACSALHRADLRLANWILSRYDADPAPLTMTHETIAARLGLRRGTVTVAAHVLEAHGAIEARRGHIEVRSRRMLQAMSCGCSTKARQAGYATHRHEHALGTKSMWCPHEDLRSNVESESLPAL